MRARNETPESQTNCCGDKKLSSRPLPQLQTLLEEYGVGKEKKGKPKDPLKCMFKSEDDVFIRVESDKNRGFPRGTVNMPGKRH